MWTIQDREDHIRATVTIKGKKLQREFIYTPGEKRTKKAAKQAAEYWVTTRTEAVKESSNGVDIANIDESISKVAGRYYMYLRLRIDREIIKSISVGYLPDKSEEAKKTKRVSPKYSEALAQLNALKTERKGNKKGRTR